MPPAQTGAKPKKIGRGPRDLETEALGAQSSKYPGPALRPGFFRVGPVWIAELQQAPSSDESTSEELYDLSTAEGVHQLQKKQVWESICCAFKLSFSISLKLFFLASSMSEWLLKPNLRKSQCRNCPFRARPVSQNLQFLNLDHLRPKVSQLQMTNLWRRTKARRKRITLMAL